MHAAHVLEVAAILHAPDAPRGAKRPVETFARELASSCPRESALVDRLLLAAVAHGRRTVARDVAKARSAGLSRAELARLTGRTVDYVARAERHDAAVSLDFWRRLRETGGSHGH